MLIGRERALFIAATPMQHRDNIDRLFGDMFQPGTLGEALLSGMAVVVAKNARWRKRPEWLTGNKQTEAKL